LPFFFPLLTYSQPLK
ncbi:pyrBI operon leader peptide, partial [Salmonella enterica]|nr:pyrBI operon leader peptide [Salmonella enterica]